MSENLKQRNTQIPQEAIKGAADKDAKYSIVGLSNEQILALGKFETLVTNKHIRDIASIDLEAGTVIKAYITTNRKEQNKGNEIGE